MRIIWHEKPIQTPITRLCSWFGLLFRWIGILLVKVVGLPFIIFFVFTGQCSLSFSKNKKQYV